jgi:charged multivesicular body protein 7
MKVIIFLLGALVAVEAGLFPDLRKWDALKVTYSLNPIKGFDNLPRQLSENKDFELRDDLCATGNGKLIGQRYWHKKDHTLSLLFDKNGYIAGIQTSLLKSQFTPPAHLQNKNYVADGDYWTLSAYFIDPRLICGAGRSKEEFEKTGTGTGLWIQMGPKATDSYHVPAKEDEIKSSKWGSGRCFPAMGQHYWYNVTKDMSCNDFVPNCMLYNGGKLNAFCFAINGMFEGPRYDTPHPTNEKIKMFMKPVPDCFFTDPSYKVESTIHIYFSKTAHYTSLCNPLEVIEGVLG